MTGEPPSPAQRPVRWHLVVPVKEASRAKTRLTPHPLERPDLARAVAHDTLDAVCRALPPGQVTVVTSDPHAALVAQRLGARLVADPGAGLNAAIRAGWSAGDGAGDGQPDVQGQGQPDVQSSGQGAAVGRPGWAVLLGDLPALRAADLEAALGLAAEHPRALVPDAEGTGTVLLTATDGPPDPRFGPGSAQRHAVDAVRLDLDLPGLRRDVDTAADLAAAVALGVGPHTGRALS